VSSGFCSCGIQLAQLDVLDGQGRFRNEGNALHQGSKGWKTLSLANAGKNPSKREGLGLRADYGNERT
jgi:hypothetical protein